MVSAVGRRLAHDALDRGADGSGATDRRAARSRAPGGSPAAIRGSCSLTREMMSSVDAEPLLITDSSEARWPSTRTTLVCGGEPLRTLATSRM